MTAPGADGPDGPVEIDRVEFEVERGKIGEFVRATAVQDPIHRDSAAARSAGLADIAATATHVVVAGHHRDQLAFVRALGLDLPRVVVGAVRWDYERPLVAGDSLRGMRHVVADERRATRTGGSLRRITLRTDYLDAADTRVVRVTETIIERSAS
ncbi:acyl dehydratase [Nakamurella sp. YIM 132087]|uniref:Acyl dehydratase n=1 Tax=Nakamurella alba TaxID=2665158 RepID=A0A7K1FEE2_9ACTN|nr:MaoC family dehydratase N-terminal domain-containing protein [Nakamurella alba]MTD12468.1 acyl dehydratase [Nakamurella alba]